MSTWAVVIFGDDDCTDLTRCPGIPAIACDTIDEAQRVFASIPREMAPHILSTITAAEFLAGSTVDN